MPKSKPPKTIPEYYDWAKRKLKIDFGLGSTKWDYDSNLGLVLNKVNELAFTKQLDGFIKQCANDYEKKTGVELLMIKKEDFSFTFKTKEYESVVDKSFRYNVVWNTKFSSEPHYDWIDLPGWVTPDNWFSIMNDTVRGRIVCKYIDGPKFLAEKLDRYAKKFKLKPTYDSRQKDDGYYAYHFYFTVPVHLRIKGDQYQKFDVDIEIQLATQLQEVLDKITHSDYQKLRIKKIGKDDLWKWDFKSARFRAGYVSHVLHFVEAAILEVRNSKPNLRKGK